MQQREQRASRDILGYNSKLAGVVQTGPHKLDDTGVVEATEDGDLSAEHVHVGLRAIRVGSIAESNSRNRSVCFFILTKDGTQNVKFRGFVTVLWQQLCFDICLCRLFRRSLSARQIWSSVTSSDYLKLVNWTENTCALRVTWSDNLVELQLRQLKVEMRREAGPEEENFCFLWKYIATFFKNYMNAKKMKFKKILADCGWLKSLWILYYCGRTGWEKER